jgi:hypothetical protein
MKNMEKKQPESSKRLWVPLLIGFCDSIEVRDALLDLGFDPTKASSLVRNVLQTLLLAEASSTVLCTETFACGFSCPVHARKT